MKKLIIYNVLVVIAVCFWAFSMIGCSKKDPILVGFSGQLSGAFADMGIQGRDAALLAVEEINASGGIAGRQIKLLVRDDKGFPDGARDADRQLIEAGVAAIIGHMTSGQTVPGAEVIQKAGVVMISPTAATDNLSGMDDYFFRVSNTGTIQGRVLAKYIHQSRGRISLAAILDMDNAVYTQTCWDAFSNEHKIRGGEVSGQWNFSSTQKPDFVRIVSKVVESAPDAVVIFASALDTALISQRVRALDHKTLLYSSPWGITVELLRHGGKSVEHMEGIGFFDVNSPNPVFQEFRSKFLARSSREPTYAGGASYESMIYLAEALNKTKGEADGLLSAIKEVKKFEGLLGTISIDEYGDPIRTHFAFRAENGVFVTKSSIEP